MKNWLLICSFLCGFVHGSSQTYIGKNKSFAKRELANYAKKEAVNTFIAETDSTISFSVRDTSVQSLDLLLHFDEEGKCFEEDLKLSCDSCFKKILLETLANGKMLWKKINASSYLSKYSKRMTLFVPSTPFTYIIQTTNLSKVEYKKLIANAVE